MNPSSGDEIEALLRAHFDGAVADDGFSDRVMQRLPFRRPAVWPRWLGVFAGVLACWMALVPSSLLRAGWHDSAHGVWSGPAIAMLAVVLLLAVLAMVWAVAEGDDF